MRRKYIFQSIVFLFLSIFNVFSQTDTLQWEYLFPLNKAAIVSGSFGEIRTNHFHSGVDLSTRGKIGWPVHAVDSGYVARISISPSGFGKALYIAHPSGYTSVYAHLSSFEKDIDSLVTALQYQQESFSINHYLEPGEITINRGEVIAYTGNSGSSGGPHLHFEIRETRQQRPIDPLMFPNPVRDDVRPHISGIKLYPLSEDARINGKAKAHYYPVVFYDGAFHLKHQPRITASGKIGIGIEVIDYYNGSWRKCGVHNIELNVNDRKVYSYQIDGFLYDNTRYLNSHIDYAEKVKTGRVIQKSFVDPLNFNDVYQTDESRGEIEMKAGSTYNFSYIVKDVSGNMSPLRFEVVGVDVLSAPKTLGEDSLIFVDASKPFDYEEKNHRVRFDQESFYRNFRGDIYVRESMISLSGTVFSVFDKTIPVHKTFEIRIPIDPHVDKKGLCGAKIGSNLKVQYAGGSIEGTHFVIKTRECGEYLIFRDTIPPKMTLKNPPSQMNYAGRKKIVLNVKDDFSGISTYKATIDGNWSLFEYDPKKSQLIGYFKKVPFLENGMHTLVVEAVDGEGNKGKLEINFRY
ncbi:M23 family metallopeptidase [Thermophagus sp. OGC60D27]|uniref:M23 family metallopeptidase n=1 Tax=Thermophagus sp. OGC60D27 TaxID=3458415 RepID=UPI00403827E1